MHVADVRIIQTVCLDNVEELVLPAPSFVHVLSICRLRALEELVRGECPREVLLDGLFVGGRFVEKRGVQVLQLEVLGRGHWIKIEGGSTGQPTSGPERRRATHSIARSVLG